jgi:hypothetical protein
MHACLSFVFGTTTYCYYYYYYYYTIRFENVGTSLLECTSCHAALKIDLPHCLSVAARARLTCKLEDELAAVHRDACPFRHDAEQYLGEVVAAETSPLVPTLLAQVWPAETMELLDQPWMVLPTRWKQVRTSIEQSCVAEWEIPAKMVNFRVKDGEGEDLLSQLVEIVRHRSRPNEEEQEEESPRQQDKERMAMALVLLGWTPETATSDQVAVQCGVCNVRLQPTRVTTTTTTGQEPLAKRPRTSSSTDLDQGHRHYCPFVCGFPWRGATRATPLWESLARRLLEPEEPSPTASSWIELRQILRAGISQKRGTLASSS